jgi:SAM-dependent methyltransferase
MGVLQFEYLRSQGLQPEHYLLDVGCGSLRAGVRFAQYLRPGHYYGVDADSDLLRRGRRELTRVGVQPSAVVLGQMSDFGFERLGRKFDFAIAQSVFTHLDLNVIMRCLVQMPAALAPGGAFYATFFENPGGRLNLSPISQGEITTYFDHDPFHYDFATFEWICEGTPLKAEYVGEWEHPRNQKMLRFTLRKFASTNLKSGSPVLR